MTQYIIQTICKSRPKRRARRSYNTAHRPGPTPMGESRSTSPPIAVRQTPLPSKQNSPSASRRRTLPLPLLSIREKRTRTRICKQDLLLENVAGYTPLRHACKELTESTSTSAYADKKIMMSWFASLLCQCVCCAPWSQT